MSALDAVHEDEQRLITVMLTPEQAGHVAYILRGELQAAIGGRVDDLADVPEADPQHVLAEIDAALMEYRGMLDAVKWGQPDGDLVVRLPHARLEGIAGDLMLRGADDASGMGLEPQERREQLRQALVGVAILDQLEARR